MKNSIVSEILNGKRAFRVFGEIVPGRKIVYLLRKQSTATTTAASLLAYTTENSRSMTADATTTTTKDGTMRTAGTPQVEINGTSILQKNDTMIDTLTAAVRNGDLMECWEANLDAPVTGQTNKFKGTYFQGYLTSLTLTSNAEGNAEISFTFAANGGGVDGNVTVTDAQQEQASYVFTDTTATG